MATSERIAYLSDIEGVVKSPSGVAHDNIALFDEDGVLKDSGKKISDLVTKDGVESAVNDATDSIWDTVKGVYAIAAFNSSSWTASTEYPAGSYCKYEGSGYRCNTEHTSSSSFDLSKWDLVLTSDGANAILAMLSAYSNEGLASLLNLAPAYSGDKYYTVGMLAKVNGVLKICTTEGRGPAAIFSTNASVELSIATRISNLVSHLAPEYSGSKDYSVGDLVKKGGILQVCTTAGTGSSAVFSTDTTGELSIASRIANLAERISNLSGAIHTKLSEFENDSGFVTGSSLVSEYDTSSGGYEVNDKCSHGGKLYICTSAVSENDEWDESHWREAYIDEIVEPSSTNEQSDWDVDDPENPAYIKNKPDIPEETQIDDTLTQPGQAADAKAVGDALKNAISSADPSYLIENLTSVPSGDSTKIAFNLSNRKVNVITISIDDSKTIRLNPPSAPLGAIGGSVFSRDFYVVLEVTADNDVSVEMPGVSLCNYAGGVVSLVAPSDGISIYRFTESYVSGNVFLVTCYADPSYSAVRDIERALDYLLKDAGLIEYDTGVFVEDEFGLYHKIRAVTDSETGKVDIGIEQEGVTR